MMVNYSGYGSWQSVPFPPERKKIDIGDYHGDYRKIANHLGWRPRIPLSEGIIETLNFYRLHQGEYW
jgi:UDP-glucose 4-epimerase